MEGLVSVSKEESGDPRSVSAKYVHTCMYLHVHAEKGKNAGHVDALPHGPVVGAIRVVRSRPVVILGGQWHVVGHGSDGIQRTVGGKSKDHEDDLGREQWRN